MYEDEKEQPVQGKKLVIADEAVPFVARGGRIFPRQVVDADHEINSGERVLIVDRKNRILTTAMAFLTPEEMRRIRRNQSVPMAG